MKKKTVSFSKKSVNVFFHILTRCNLKCRHCYINPKAHGKKTLPIHDIEKWLAEFSQKRMSANVIFLGGEPTLHPDLPRAVKKARSLGYRSVTIDTNGYLFNDILEKISPSELDFFSFSLDGATKQTNDRIRGRGSFVACVKGIRKAVSIGFNTSLIFTVSNENIHELAMMPPFLEDLGIDRFFIQVIGLRGNFARGENDKARPENLQVSKKKWLDLIPEVARDAAGRGIITTYPKVYLDPEERFECAGLVADNYFIFPNGRVYRCPLCEDFPIHSMMFENNRLKSAPRINEGDLFHLNIPEGCVMNRLIQPENLEYTAGGKPKHKIACCLLKEEVY
jgi:MoaA/NifB/PqqE/SkfB family radical SAM enzyme